MLVGDIFSLYSAVLEPMCIDEAPASPPETTGVVDGVAVSFQDGEWIVRASSEFS